MTGSNVSTVREASALCSEDWVQKLIDVRNRFVHRGYTPNCEYYSDWNRRDISSADRFKLLQANPSLSKFDDQLFLNMAKRDFSHGAPGVMSDGSVRDDRGMVTRDFDLEAISKGYLIEFEKWDERIAVALLRDGLASGVTAHQPMDQSYGGAGPQMMVHRTVGMF
jgi:hypothetical protein